MMLDVPSFLIGVIVVAGVMIAICWRWLVFGDDELFIAHWSDDRAKHYERLTYRYLGIRPEPSFMWSRKYRQRKKKRRREVESNVTQFEQKRKAG